MSRDVDRLTSVGIDVGTTTTQVVVSRLHVSKPTHDGAAAPEIREREIVHRGTVHETPLVDAETIDVDGVAALVREAFDAAGIDPDDVDTGAVIVTGETAKRANAESLVHRIAADAGDFVAAAAGAELEAVLAGRGSGAAAHARTTGRVVANVDVGGGTTNVAVFGPDGVVDTRCLDVGARMVRTNGHTMTHLSAAARRLRDAHGLAVDVGDDATIEALRPLADAAAESIADLLVGPPFADLVASGALGELSVEPVAIDDVVVTGGVGHLLNAPKAEPDPSPSGEVDNPFRYGDLGPLLAATLGETLRARAELPARPIVLEEDLRATVVGVGTESTTFSGRTVWLPADRLPLRDVPVVVVDPDPVEGAESESTDVDRFARALRTARDLYDLDDVEGIALYVERLPSLGYDDLSSTADRLAAALRSEGFSGDADADRAAYGADVPIVVVTGQNCAKVLGQLLASRLEGPITVLDELALREGVRLDVGEPLQGRDAVPVVVKTLAFGGD
ncbi:ethanolamine ammonia-lyase reactivating factor EutA [Halorubrum luteum]